MPTGYTSEIKDGITFQQFAMRCARAFGALVMMRDDPADAPIPDEFPISDYHQKHIVEASERLAELRGMSLISAEATAKRDFDKAVAAQEEYIADRLELKAKYEDMLAKVKAWIPPTPDHQGLKDFMVKQITDSIEWDCSLDHLDKPKLLTAQEWLTERTNDALRHLEYHTEEHRDEVERVTGRMGWVKALKASLPADTIKEG